MDTRIQVYYRLSNREQTHSRSLDIEGVLQNECRNVWELRYSAKLLDGVGIRDRKGRENQVIDTRASSSLQRSLRCGVIDTRSAVHNRSAEHYRREKKRSIAISFSHSLHRKNLENALDQDSLMIPRSGVS